MIASIVLILLLVWVSPVLPGVTFSGTVTTAGQLGVGGTPADFDFYVATTGNDNNDGSQGSPWRTIQKAANTATAGQRVSVAAGTYIERVDFANSGTAGNEIEFVGQGDTTIVDGGSTGSGWTQSGGYPTGVFEIANSAFGFTGGEGVPAHATVGGKMVAFVLPDSSPDHRDKVSLGVGDSKWTGVEVFCGNWATITRCHFQDNADPDTKDIKLAPIDRGAFNFSGKSYITITGFYFKNAFSCAHITNFSHHILWDNNICTNGFYGVRIENGSYSNTLQDSTWFLNWIYANHGLPRYDAAGTLNTIQNNIFNVLRVYMPVTASIAFFDAGADNKVLHNTLDYTAAAGVHVASNSPSTTGYSNENIEVAYNTFSHCQDYCGQILSGAEAGGYEFHDNIIHTYYNGHRFGYVLSGSDSIYVYRNQFYNYEATTAIGAGCDLEFSYPANPNVSVFANVYGYFYHNTMAGDDCTGSYYGQSVDNLFYMNNVFSGGGFWYTSPGLPEYPYFYGNWAGGSGWNTAGCCSSWADAHNIFTSPNRIWGDGVTDFTLPNGHAAIDYGVDLSETWTAGSYGEQPPMPGMTGDFLGTAPDAGAVETQ